MDHFAMMARFNRWVNALLYGSVAQLSDAQYRKDIGLYFGSVQATLNHLLLVDLLWTRRLRGEPNGATSLTEILHDDFASLRKARVAEDERFVAFVDSLKPADLAKAIRFKPILGKGEFEEARADHILATLNNHQTHHRGQVHAALTQAGIEPPALDVLYFLEEIGAAGKPGTVRN
ncbi:MAG: DinB family protein [Rhodospirillaceae bacterium]|mgnify:CR=1 FL=1|nr:DinB family protein [Rhodospirillaceae bacterium]